MATAQTAPDPAWVPTLTDVMAAAAVVAALGWAYAPSLADLVGQWGRDPNYNYGYLVVPIALVILWSRRGLLDRSKLRPGWWALLPLAAAVAVRYPLFERNEQYVETATLPVVVACLTLAMGGWHLLRVAGPAVLFLVFVLPLPPSLNTMLAGPLQTLATVGSVACLQVIGMPVLAEGNVIVVGDTPLEVARACNGLSMLLSFVTLITATVLLVRRPIWERVFLLASTVPIALVTNIARITATAVCFRWFGHETGERIAHDLAGWAMMPMALALVWAELAVSSWLFVEVEVRRADPRDYLRRGRPSGA